MCKKHKAIVGTALLSGDVAATLYITFYLRFISNDIHPLIWIGFVLNVLAVIACYWMVGSPSWLVAIGDTEKAKKNILYIAKFNGVTDMKTFQIVPDSD